MQFRRIASVALGATLVLLASPLAAPQLLAFPYRAQSSIGTVWSDVPIDPLALDAVTSETRRLLAESPISEEDGTRSIFLTNGGWRWLWLANTSRGGFALTRPISAAVIVNASNLQSDRVTNEAAIAGERSLSAVLAHEFTHGDLRRHFGFVHMAMQPQWKVEGYADHIAQESSLSPEEAENLIARGESHPALIYFEGRQQVAAELEANGGSVEALFESGD